MALLKAGRGGHCPSVTVAIALPMMSNGHKGRRGKQEALWGGLKKILPCLVSTFFFFVLKQRRDDADVHGMFQEIKTPLIFPIYPEIKSQFTSTLIFLFHQELSDTNVLRDLVTAICANVNCSPRPVILNLFLMMYPL